MMKLLTAALAFTVLAYACQIDVIPAQQVSKKESSINESKKTKKVEKAVVVNSLTHSPSDKLFPSDDFLFVSLIMMN